MNCLSFRDRLSEGALGGLAPGDRTLVDRHLQWCAACRKEAAEMERAAATLAFSAAPAEPDPLLEDRVVGAVRTAAGRHQPAHGPARRGRLAVAAVVAAMIAVSGLGWGAVMAGRAERSQQQANAAVLRQQSTFDNLQRLLRNLEFSDPDSDAFIGTLAPTPGGSGGGSAITVVSPSLLDLAIVIVNGLPPAPKDTLPYTVLLQNAGGRWVMVGRIRELDSGGGAKVARDDLNRDLAGFDRVVVRDAGGRLVLRGVLGTQAPLSSPSP